MTTKPSLWHYDKEIHYRLFFTPLEKKMKIKENIKVKK
jgi:hypothetical protein